METDSFTLGDKTDGKNTRVVAAIAAIVVVIACAAVVYYMLHDDDAPDEGNHQYLSEPDVLLLVPEVGGADTYTGTVNFSNPMGGKVGVTATVNYSEYIGGQDVYRIGLDLSVEDASLKSLVIQASMKGGTATLSQMTLWDYYATGPIALDEYGSTLDFEGNMVDGYRIELEAPGMGEHITIGNSDGWFDIGVGDGLYAVKVQITALYEYAMGATFTATGELDIWLPGEFQN